MPEAAKYHEKGEITFVDGYGEVTSNDVINFVQYVSNTVGSFNAKGMLYDHRKVESLPDFVNTINLGSQAGLKLKN